MDMLVWGIFIGVLIGLACGAVVSGAAYRNGATDGYGYAREPSCPGYKKAGDYLKKTMAHRWSELRDNR